MNISKKSEQKDVTFIDNDNIRGNMLNSSGLHLNEYGTTRLVNNFCYHVNR